MERKLRHGNMPSLVRASPQMAYLMGVPQRITQKYLPKRIIQKDYPKGVTGEAGCWNVRGQT
jgi:hypothetical protein